MRRQLTDCWDGGDDLTKLELVKDSGLTSGVETDLESGWAEWMGRRKKKGYIPSEYL